MFNVRASESTCVSFLPSLNPVWESELQKVCPECRSSRIQSLHNAMLSQTVWMLAEMPRKEEAASRSWVPGEPAGLHAPAAPDS